MKCDIRVPLFRFVEKEILLEIVKRMDFVFGVFMTLLDFESDFL